MIKCTIIVEEIPGRGLQIAVMPEPDNPTDHECRAWKAYEVALSIASDYLFSESKPGAQMVQGNEDIRGLVEERIANLRKLKDGQ